MRNLAISLKRSTFALTATMFTVMLAAANISVLSGASASADQILDRSLTLSSTLAGSVTGNGQANDPTNGSDATHKFVFTVPSTSSGAIRSIKFEYCTTSIGTCVAPPGPMSTTGTAITTQYSTGTTPFTNPYTVSSASVNNILLTQGTGNTFTSGNVVTIAMDDITNPAIDATNNAFYVHISYYLSADGTGPVEDDGTVASAITEGINITAKVKETLNFSVTGDAAAAVDPAPDTCPALTGSGNIVLGDSEGVLDFGQAYTNNSYFRTLTNATGGIVIQYRGDTLRKGGIAPAGIPIASLTSATASDPGTEQFGLRLDILAAENYNVTASGSAYAAGSLRATAAYDSATLYNFDDTTVTPANAAETIADSTGYVDCSGGSVEYVANISPNTPAGVYTTAITYYAVPKY